MNPFTRHPNEIGETYWTHLWFALGWSKDLLLLGVFAFLHALFPFIFVDTVSTRLNDLCEEGKRRRSPLDT